MSIVVFFTLMPLIALAVVLLFDFLIVPRG
jgi:hypothetical protein